MCGPGGSVGIAIDYGLEGPGIESWWGARFSAPVQTSPGAHLAFCTMGTGPFPGLKCGRGVTLATHPFLAPRSWKSRAIPLPPPPLWATTGPVTGLLYLYIYRISCTCLSGRLENNSIFVGLGGWGLRGNDRKIWL
jgi:hypothetical protein